jgi:hypothetical protein
MTWERARRGRTGPAPALAEGVTMESLELVFATVVGVLAGLAVVGALTFALVWEIAAIRRVLERNRKPTPEESFWRDHAAVRVPERRADA